jgi:hypothetical protein
MRVKPPTRSAAAPRIGRGQQEYFNGLLDCSWRYSLRNSLRVRNWGLDRNSRALKTLSQCYTLQSNRQQIDSHLATSLRAARR